MENSKTTSRIMIIIWKWQEEFLRNDGKWSVYGPKNQGDFVYCIKEGKNLSAILESIAKVLSNHADSPETFIFFHRIVFPDASKMGQFIEQLTQTQRKSGQIKVFLFSADRDYIYITTQREGLLGVDGRFGDRIEVVDPKSGERRTIAIEVVLDKEKQILKADHFEKVWDYYSHEFKKKIANLKEDLFHYFIKYISREKPINADILYQHLDKGPLLKLRVKSLMGRLREEEERLLATNEREAQQSYIFDDCNENLLLIYGQQAKLDYKALISNMEPLLNPPFEPVCPHKLLTDIRDGFDNLLSRMPESTYY